MTLTNRSHRIVEACKIPAEPEPDFYPLDTKRGHYLWSPDLAPVEPARRTWSWYSFVNLWISASFNVNTWQLAGSYVAGGLSWWQGWLCIWVGYIMTGIFVALGGRMGAVYHIPFPVAIRSSFGIYGAYWPVINRILLAIIWFSVQSWIGGQCMWLMLTAIWPSTANIPNMLPDSAQTDTAHMMSFFLFWLIQLPGIWFPLHTVRHLYSIKGVIAPVAGVLFTVWVVVKSGSGAGPVIKEGSKLTGSTLVWTIIQALISSLDNFSTFILNDSDFTRFAKKPSAAVWSQIICVPMCFALTSLIGLIVSSCSATLYGSALWNPLDVLENFVTQDPSSATRAGVFFLGLVFAYAQMMNNMTGANSAGSDLTALFPRFLNIRRGGYVGAVLAWACCPWNLLSSSNNFLTYVNAYSVFLSAFVGPFFCDYFLVRKGHLSVVDLYSNDRLGPYWSWHGIGVNAWAAYLIGIIFNIVGFAGAVGAPIPIGAWYLYQFNFLGGFFISGGAYYILCRWGPFKVKIEEHWNETGDSELASSIMIHGIEINPRSDEELAVTISKEKEAAQSSVTAH